MNCRISDVSSFLFFGDCNDYRLHGFCETLKVSNQFFFVLIDQNYNDKFLLTLAANFSDVSTNRKIAVAPVSAALVD